MKKINSFVRLIFIILIGLSLIRSFGESNPISFSGLLNFLGNTDFTLSDRIFTFIKSDLITDEWVGFNWLRDFINGFVNLTSIALWLSALIIEGLVFVGKILVYVFV